MVSTKNSSLIIAPGFYQENAAFEKMVSSNNLVNLKKRQHQRSQVSYLKNHITVNIYYNLVNGERKRVVSHTS